jgi:hypothetical protein
MAQAAVPAPAPITALGVFALLGDTIQLAQPLEPSASRLDPMQRSTLTVKDLGLDQAALRAVREVMVRRQPAVRLEMFRSTTPLTPAQQREIADGAARAELPAWIVSAITSAKLSHLLLITRHRGEASFPVLENFTIGRGTVEGVGYYIDTLSEMKNVDTGLATRGFLGAYAQLRLQLMDAVSGDIVASRDVRIGQIYAGRNDAEIGNIWLTLDPVEKTEVLRQLVQDNVGRVLRTMVPG